MRKSIFCSFLFAFALSAPAASRVEKYIDWGHQGSVFPYALEYWQPGMPWSPDDNFFISRQRPRARFRNQATQVNPALTEDVDKKLIFWVPVNRRETNGLPDGCFDSEVFPFWSYVTHYGNWTAKFVRIPGSFLDVAHRNGVPVSCVASVPWGYLNVEWEASLGKLMECGADRVAEYMKYYGVDGLGYNSEFFGPEELVDTVGRFNGRLLRDLRESNPIAENIWYDGTNEKGWIYFDRGLGEHNDDLWGYGSEERSALFFNYNWPRKNLLPNSVAHARKVGRTPLDLYCGINMQGREPKKGDIWPLLAQYPLSIGLWGAHEQNMFFETRAERGPLPAAGQRTYLRRIENWFTGSSRNPVTSPDLNNSLIYGADVKNFAGMSKLMSARSALKWNLSEEPFRSCFNLGNGTFFNWQGRRANNSEWYNIGVQDYMPTWMWWLADTFMGRSPENVPAGGLEAEFTWDDAWLGGSCLRISGSTTREFLHLFKTEFTLADGDVVTLRYKLRNGSASARLALAMKGEESVPVNTPLVSVDAPADEWRTLRYVVGKDIKAADRDLALVALEFDDSSNLDLLLGEFSVVRPGAASVRPEAPVIEKGEILAAGPYGADAKLIWHMPNDMKDRVCYNTDVNTSLFKLYARQRGHKPVLMGITTSWAGLMFGIPVDFLKGKSDVALGVSALSLDGTNESPISWTNPLPARDKYVVAEGITLSDSAPAAGEPFSISYSDPLHTASAWSLADVSGRVVAENNGTSINLPKGLSEGVYSLTLRERDNTLRTFTGLVKVGDSAPEASIRIGDEGQGFGCYLADTGIKPGDSFSIACRFRADTFEDNASHLLNIRDRADKWDLNHFGWIRHTMNSDGTVREFVVRSADGKDLSYEFGETRLQPGVWYDILYTFDFDKEGKVLPSLFIDGKKQKVTAWSQGDEACPADSLTHAGKLYDVPEKAMLSIGGILFKSGSAVGDLADVRIWKKAVTTPQEQDSLIGRFDFKTDPDRENLFSNSAGSFKAGTHIGRDTETEGQAQTIFIKPKTTK